MNDEIDSAPPPEGMTPRKPWTKPTLKIIGETIRSARGGPDMTYAEGESTPGVPDGYAPTS